MYIKIYVLFVTIITMAIMTLNIKLTDNYVNVGRLQMKRLIGWF